ncbi:hypothetical protein PTSG_13268 [Salpingoeca rosetta]|uniref:Uncharacterized protein n=1 Tax=Salpingoeca rosetta (strain ATCC 50818 / BSB-021) TaxID=946362 RepID=F2URP4_SALR5|nr:uncharacterized protein PTSG_13268 [Salpingoeca rosetta]EGD80299.1 hypothetical protein PTSG_13268 [Salpingoeca rosetta]|eukprot:XP_004988089.1 hypothetical protein PTSG_13268 [Salpingoeca rosetta]
MPSATATTVMHGEQASSADRSAVQVVEAVAQDGQTTAALGTAARVRVEVPAVQHTRRPKTALATTRRQAPARLLASTSVGMERDEADCPRAAETSPVGVEHAALHSAVRALSINDDDADDDDAFDSGDGYASVHDRSSEQSRHSLTAADVALTRRPRNVRSEHVSPKHSQQTRQRNRRSVANGELFQMLAHGSRSVAEG